MRQGAKLITLCIALFVVSGYAFGDPENFALFKPATASGWYNNSTPDRAVDGNPDLAWGVGASTGWIEVDFEGLYEIDSIRMLVTMSPNGTAHHEVMFYISGAWVEVWDIHEHLVDQTWIELTFSPTIRGVSKVRVETLSSPSWVSWREIEVYGVTDTGGILSADLTCSPSWGTLPMSPQFGVTLENLVDNYRTFAGRVDVTLALGSMFTNYRSGYTNLMPMESREIWWSQYFPDVGTVVGENTFLLSALDVTPSPYNQPPFWPSGSSDTSVCVVEGSRGKTINASLNCEPEQGTVPYTSEICILLENNTTYTRQYAFRVERQKANGGFDPNYRNGFQNVAPKSTFPWCWDEVLADDGSMTGENTYQVIVMDVTPSPYNQPPYPTAGDTDSSACTVTGLAP